MTKFKQTNWLALLLVLVLCLSAATSAERRIKRQATQNERPSGGNSQKQRPSVQIDANLPGVDGASAASMATSMSGNMPNVNAQATPVMGDARPVGMSRPGRPKVKPLATANPMDQGYDQDEEEPEMPPRRQRRPPASRGPKGPGRRPAGHSDHEEDEDCDDYDGYDYGNMFHAAFRPMRQMGDMMSIMFEHMQGIASGDYQDLPEGNYAMASARSSGDGYSKLSSIVNNNGRRRGVVSETRNGRTQTRRIGDDGGDEE